MNTDEQGSASGAVIGGQAFRPKRSLDDPLAQPDRPKLHHSVRESRRHIDRLAERIGAIADRVVGSEPTDTAGGTDFRDVSVLNQVGHQPSLAELIGHLVRATERLECEINRLDGEV